MIKEASKMVDLAVEFCRNNLDNLMVYGALFAIFVVIISIVRVSRKEDDEDLDFDEVAYKKELAKESTPEQEAEDAAQEVTEDVEAGDTKEPVGNEFAEVILPALLERIIAEENAKDENCQGVAEVEFVEVALPPLTARVMAYEDVEDVEEVEEIVEIPVTDEPVIEEPVVKTPMENMVAQQKVSRNTSCLEEIIEGLANLSADGVKKVEIKIKDAEVKITYGDDQTVSIKEEPRAEDLPLEAEFKDELEEVQEYEEKKEEITEAKTYKKFGPNNNNVTRSGRVFSEEELQKQIRD